jgi:hypothetical protein
MITFDSINELLDQIEQHGEAQTRDVLESLGATADEADAALESQAAGLAVQRREFIDGLCALADDPGRQ